MKSKVLTVLLALLQIVLIAGCIFPVSGCDRQIEMESDGQQEMVIPAQLEAPVKLQVNQTAEIEPEKVRVEFINVSEDSRCPSEVFCIQAGQVKVLFNLFKDRQKIDNVVLTSRGDRENSEMEQFDGYSLKLLEVGPYPTSTQGIELSEYWVTIVVSKV